MRVEMTESALEFIGPQTFAAITGEHPFTSLFAADLVSPHTELARWAELVIVAPPPVPRQVARTASQKTW